MPPRVVFAVAAALHWPSRQKVLWPTVRIGNAARFRYFWQERCLEPSQMGGPLTAGAWRQRRMALAPVNALAPPSCPEHEFLSSRLLVCLLAPRTSLS